jgi:invasion protein IalB
MLDPRSSNEPAALNWRRSSLCSNVTCAEVAVTAEAVHLRDAKNPAAVQTYTHQEWQAFVDGVRAGEFDLPG